MRPPETDSSGDERPLTTHEVQIVSPRGSVYKRWARDKMHMNDAFDEATWGPGHDARLHYYHNDHRISPDTTLAELRDGRRCTCIRIIQPHDDMDATDDTNADGRERPPHEHQNPIKSGHVEGEPGVCLKPNWHQRMTATARIGLPHTTQLLQLQKHYLLSSKYYLYDCLYYNFYYDYSG